MKKLWIGIIAVLMIVSVVGYSQDIHWANQVTIEWDIVTTMTNGDPIPAGDVITYRVWQRLNGVEDEIAEVSITEYTFTFIHEGIYTAGVQTVRYPENGDPPLISGINWSDVNGVMTPNPFFLGYYLAAPAPENLRIQ